RTARAVQSGATAREDARPRAGSGRRALVVRCGREGFTLMLRLSVLVPAYNEQTTIIELLRRVRAQSVAGVEFEVIVVDDGSRDNTVALLNSNPDLYDKLVVQPKNGGKGAAVRAGLGVATGDYVLFQDADLEYDPS